MLNSVSALSKFDFNFFLYSLKTSFGGITVNFKGLVLLISMKPFFSNVFRVSYIFGRGRLAATLISEAVPDIMEVKAT